MNLPFKNKMKMKMNQQILMVLQTHMDQQTQIMNKLKIDKLLINDKCLSLITYDYIIYKYFIILT